MVGEVSVGISTAAVHHQLWTDVRTAAVLVGLALLIGVVGSVLLARRWRGLTMGLQPSEMAELIRGQAAVLHGIGEGVLAVDTAWKTTFVNDEACRLLEISNEPGRPVENIGLTPTCARGVQVGGSDANARHCRRSDRGGLGATRGA